MRDAARYADMLRAMLRAAVLLSLMLLPLPPVILRHAMLMPRDAIRARRCRRRCHAAAFRCQHATASLFHAAR